LIKSPKKEGRKKPESRQTNKQTNPDPGSLLYPALQLSGNGVGEGDGKRRRGFF